MRGANKRVQNADPEDYKIMIDQIMLKFRPIAPRPSPVHSLITSVPLNEQRRKRKYVRTKKTKKMTSDECNLTNFSHLTHFTIINDKQRISSNGGEFVVTRSGRSVDPTVTVIESWITIESVTGTCEYGTKRLQNCTDDEIWKDLEADSCPGFVSNGYGEVERVNIAYRRMMDPVHVGGGKLPEVVVRLGVKVEEKVFERWPGFSCRVSVVYRLLGKMKRMTVPCDVWRMESGGYAWRLDVKAALSLGRVD